MAPRLFEVPPGRTDLRSVTPILSDLSKNTARHQGPLTHRVLVVDKDPDLIAEYVHCLSDEFEADDPTSTLTDLEKVWLRDESDDGSVASFEVHSRNQGEAAVAAVSAATEAGRPYAIVFLDKRLPPGLDGLEAARQIREIDPNVNLVIVSDSLGDKPDMIAREIPPADRIFFFQKPFMGVECRQLAAALCGKWHADQALRMANEALEQRVQERTAALHKLAYYDPVTRLPNQYLLLDQLDAAIEISEDKEGDTAVILLDVDRFSFMNETMGFDSGTELLRSIGNRLGRTFVEDGKFAGAAVGRFGADEFAIIVPGVSSEEQTRELAQRVKQTVEAPFLIHGRDLFLKASVGAAWHPTHGRTARAVFRCAEAALHRSMRSIDSPVTYYHREMRYRARHRFALEAELRMAIDNGRIRAWYQPQQSIATGELVGVEALARWEREDGSIISPGEFIPVAEEMGMADGIFECMLSSVCSDIVALRGEMDWQVPVSVNLSAHQLRSHGLVRQIRRALEGAEIERGLICLELTETVLLEDLSVAEPVLRDLSAYGVGIHIDDFGTGYSSLSYLAQLPVQVLKIDRTFISQVADSESTRRVVQAVVALGKALKLEVVAEGVETDRQFADVRRLGCDIVQGYFVAKPMPAMQLLRWCQGYESTESLKCGGNVVSIERSSPTAK